MIETNESKDATKAAGRYWKANPNAENVDNLPNLYYEQQLGGKSLDWLRVYVGGNYGFVKEGNRFGRNILIQI